MRNIIYILSTLIFIILAPVLFILVLIPILILGLYLRIWTFRRTEKSDSLNNEKRIEDYTRNRTKDLIPIFKDLIPSDAKSALDIGSGRDMKKLFVKDFFEKYICLDVKNADIEQDLNINNKINLSSNSVKMVIMSNILEHLVDPLPIALEANRIAEKYIIVGLPNEYPLDERLLILFGIYYDKIYPLGHKHRLSLKSIEEFISLIWSRPIKKAYKFQFIGARFIPQAIRKILIKLFPSLFVGEVFYLIKKEENKRQKN